MSLTTFTCMLADFDQFKQNYFRVAVRLGEHRISTLIDCLGDDCSDPVQDIPIQTAQKHEQYDKRKKLHDIALLRLQTEAVFGSSVKTICLPTSTSNQLDSIEPHLRARMKMTGNKFPINRKRNLIIKILTKRLGSNGVR